MTAFALGFLGALLPEIVRLYNLRQEIKAESFGAGYIVISVLYATAGGVVSYLLTGSSSEINSIYVGFAFPTIVNQGARQAMGGSRGADAVIEELAIAPYTWKDRFRTFTYAA